jgi:hypothetical protein
MIMMMTMLMRKQNLVNDRYVICGVEQITSQETLRVFSEFCWRNSKTRANMDKITWNPNQSSPLRLQYRESLSGYGMTWRFWGSLFGFKDSHRHPAIVVLIHTHRLIFTAF